MLSIQEIARELRVSEKTIRRMLWRGNLKGIRVGGQWRFPIENLAELLPSKAPLSDAEEHPVVGASRCAAIRDLLDIGGIHYRIDGDNPREVLQEAVNATPLIPPSYRPALFEAIWRRESLCSTGIGKGIAVPHPKVPMAVPNSRIPSLVGLHFLEHPVDYGAVDNQKVSVLFLLLLKTPQEHLQTLSRLMHLLREDSFVSLLHEAPIRSVIHAELARLEGTLIPEGP